MSLSQSCGCCHMHSGLAILVLFLLLSCLTQVQFTAESKSIDTIKSTILSFQNQPRKLIVFSYLMLIWFLFSYVAGRVMYEVPEVAQVLTRKTHLLYYPYTR